ASTSRKFGGTGLGLSISKQLVEGMGGTIGVESETGKGSRFWFEVPLQALPEDALPPMPPVSVKPVDEAVGTSEATAADPQPVSAALATGQRILLVDDHIINLKLGEALLKKHGVPVDITEDGAQAVEAAAKFPYALILMDMQMPVMDGLEATRRIRSGPGASMHSAIVALTANAMASDRAKCLESGMNDVLVKPLDKKLLAQCVYQYVETAVKL
ncbi:MAG: hybrid sensor histidine kinase/response regulator, partial [Burkholderiales bacterium PBB4]